LLASVYVVAQAREVTKEEVQEITSNLVCQCGCGNKTVSLCGCGTADQVTRDVGKLLREGKTKDEIFAKYVGASGPAILATPPKKGFNLTAWVLPFLGILIASVFVLAKAKQWQQQTDKQEVLLEKQGARERAAPDPYRERLHRELEKLD
jgi:cytochrome c-type biogenesis protein CcmH